LPQQGFDIGITRRLCLDPVAQHLLFLPHLVNQMVDASRQALDRQLRRDQRDVLAGFGDLADDSVTLYPEQWRSEIDSINQVVYDRVNNGVYKAGFATTQSAYEAAVGPLFATLDELDSRLSGQRWLVGSESPTEADWRLFTTLVRFDAVYVGHFKCNIRRIADYPSLSGYLRDLYRQPGIAETVRIDEIKAHYYATHPMINPTGIIPSGPELDLDSDPGREHLA
jgi:putative glutathione S-transferase